jgi:competence/damage-inducible protein CinA-like protein
MGLIVAALRQGLARSELVITTGGLGPTVDDMTREAVALAVGRPLVFDAQLQAQIEERFRRWGRTMSGNNLKQAYRPEGSRGIENPVGTAPCFSVEQRGRLLVCLPGVPREMEFLMDQAVSPLLRQRFNLTGIIKSRALKVAGIGESQVDERVGDLEALTNPAVGLNAHSGVIVIRVTATAASEAAADALIAPVEASIRERLGELVFGADVDTLEGAVLAELGRRGETLAVVETGTGGCLAGKLALADLDTGVFVSGKILGASPSASLQTLAEQAAAEAHADWGLACALCVEEGQSRLAVYVCSADGAEEIRRGFGGHPGLAPEWSANLALNALREALSARQR